MNECTFIHIRIRNHIYQAITRSHRTRNTTRYIDSSNVPSPESSLSTRATRRARAGTVLPLVAARDCLCTSVGGRRDRSVSVCLDESSGHAETDHAPLLALSQTIEELGKVIE